VNDEHRCIDLPDGRGFRIRVKLLLEKYFAFSEIGSGVWLRCLALLQRGVRVVTNVERGMRWTARIN
jgi:hypothetical protein